MKGSPEVEPELISLSDNKDQRSFVISAFMNGLYSVITQDLGSMNKAERGKFYSHAELLIKSLIENCRVELAVVRGSPEDFLGFIIYQPMGDDLAVYWVYTKELFRRFGLARWMINTKARTKDKIFYRWMPEKKFKKWKKNHTEGCESCSELLSKLRYHPTI